MNHSMKLGFVALLCLSFTNATEAQNYPELHFNKAPLKQNVFIQLPLGSIRAKGWLLKQLEQQRDGATGMAEALYAEDDNLGKNNDWLGGKGSSWERAPYYVKGLIALAYTLDDPILKEKAKKYIEWTLGSQQPSGLFGPAKMKDWWPRMPMMYALQSYYEATNDQRVIQFLTKYFKYELTNLDADPLKDWAKSRAADNMEIALWLYNKTEDGDLLKLVEKLKQQAYPWIDIYNHNQFYYFGDDFQPKHMVNVAQALKFPAIYAQLNPSAANEKAMMNGIAHIMRDHGQPEGLGSGTEFLAGTASIEGVETCTVVEWMQSLETAARIIHDAKIGDDLEKVAFNALPAQFSRDFKNHSYYTLPNQVQSVHGEHGFNQDYSSGIVSSPYSGYGCCRYNMHMGWPYYVKNSASATPDNGLAILTYGPMEINTTVSGNKVKITEETNYPFDDLIKLKISTALSFKFPLVLRIPSWSIAPLVKVNGTPIKNVKAGTLLTISREWKDNDQVELQFPMEVAGQKQVNNSLSVVRGPLVYALEIKPEYKITKTHQVVGYKDYESRPVSSWNYGLVLNPDKIDEGVRFIKGKMAENPFDATQSPVKLVVKAKKIPSWTLAYNQMSAFDVPFSPVESKSETEEITLVPYGAENLRLSCFPIIGTPSKPVTKIVEDFNTHLPNDWVFYGGGWFWKDGGIHASSNAGSGGFGINGSKIVANGTHFSNLDFQASVKVNTAGDAGLMFRVSKPAIGPDAYQGYYVGLNPVTGIIELGKATGLKWIPIQSKKYTLEMNKIYQLRVVANGQQIKVYVDESKTPIIQASDMDYSSGSIGLRTYKAQATFDAVKVKEI
ncbi:beta-L-arabinofuranosidase domain-containing protein [Pedobacter sp.]|uniref:beta-L-arabinofuranosidase domain-containing protein n=1 Tax=Pedobacter sp. TaxID=1411316 RepID=UPI003BAC1CB7